jgi:hypothetical protein
VALKRDAVNAPENVLWQTTAAAKTKARVV